MSLYITADAIGIPTGGGAVTYHESEALKSFDINCYVGGRENLLWIKEHRSHLIEGELEEDPWLWDNLAKASTRESRGFTYDPDKQPKGSIAHFYAGTFTKTIQHLKKCGYKISYTAAAHSIEESRKEHESLGLPYAYPHLTDPILWERYVRGYLESDILICPSKHSAAVMRSYGADEKRIRIIPHGCEIPERVAPLPDKFCVGYLGAYGPDKGVRYLLEAWKRLNYQDATLVLAGRDSTSPFALALVNAFGGGRIELMGWVDNVSDFYNNTSLYVQPSVSEGFGIEVLEAMTHHRAVVCSEGAGASDLLSSWYKFKPRDVDDLASKIDQVKLRGACQGWGYPNWQEIASKYTWKEIRGAYISVWKEMLNG